MSRILQPRSIVSSLALAAAVALLGPLGLARAADRLGVVVRSDGLPLVMNRLGVLTDATGRGLSITRLDFLLSEVEFQRSDGSWVGPRDWHGLFRGNEPGRQTALGEVAAGEYQAVRFGVGVPQPANHGNPNLLAPDHALHPVTNGLHWGWATGYIFIAAEGHWQLENAPPGVTGGWSYHLGNNENYSRVELRTPVRLTGGGLVMLALDVKALLKGIDITEDGESTHSRSQDSVVTKLRQNLQHAFSVASSGADESAISPGSTALSQERGTPYPFSTGANLPQVQLPPDNLPTVAGVELGRDLFHDKRLSRDLSLSCASCHAQESAFTDPGRTLSVGVEGRVGTRNAMPIFNLAWTSEFFWDGRAKGLRNQALMPIQDHLEMDESMPAVVRKLEAAEGMGARFDEVFGAGGITADRVGLALEQFMLTQVSQDSKFDRVARGEGQFTAEEKRGFELFLTEHDPFRGLYGADCFHCHGGGLFTTHQFTNNGLAILNGDTGREKVTGDPADRGKFRTPSLRNVALTAPYMHDGRFKTLEEVVEHYDHGVERSATLDPNLAKHPAEGLKLSAEDKRALVAFMKTLTDPKYRAGEAKVTEAE
jgi:cytochrome c peroxidase